MNIILFRPEECSLALPRTDYRARHLLHTLGAQAGDAYNAGIMGGAVGRMLIHNITAQEIQFRFIPAETETAPPLLPITLLIGHPRPLVTKRLVGDLSNIGVKAIHFFIGENSEKSYLKSNIWRDGILKQMCIEGAEQAGTTAIPDLYRHADLAHALRVVDECGIETGRERQYLTLPNEALSVAALPEGVKMPLFMSAAVRGGSNAASIGSTAMIIAVGAERGWTENEIRTLHRYRYQPRTLGRRILRTATIAVAVSVLAAQRYSVAVVDERK